MGSWNYENLGKKKLAKLQDYWKNKKYLIIDEKSFIGKRCL